MNILQVFLFVQSSCTCTFVFYVFVFSFSSRLRTSIFVHLLKHLGMLLSLTKWRWQVKLLELQSRRTCKYLRSNRQYFLGATELSGSVLTWSQILQHLVCCLSQRLSLVFYLTVLLSTYLRIVGRSNLMLVRHPRRWTLRMVVQYWTSVLQTVGWLQLSRLELTSRVG